MNFDIDLHVFPVSILVSIGQTDQELTDVLSSVGVEFSTIDLGLDEYTDGLTHSYDSGHIVIRFHDNPSDKIITHEVVHAAWGTMRHIGVTPSQDSEEVYAYLNDYIFDKIKDGIRQELSKPQRQA